MKRCIFILLSLLVQFTFAQEKSFTGFGIFQLGSDTTALYNYAAEMKVKVVVTDNSQDVLLGKLNKQGEVTIFKMLRNADKAKNYSGMAYCPDLAEFYLSAYSGEGVDMKLITLKYYHNKLIHVELNLNKILLDGMSAKYGKRKMVSKSDTITCSGPDGISHKLLAQKSTIPLKIGDVSFWCELEKTYNENCKTVYHGLLAYEITNKEATDCEDEAKKKAQ